MKFAQVNYLNDVIMPTLKDPVAFTLVSLIARNTWGRDGVEWVELSFGDIKEATGISSPNTIKRAVAKAEQFIEQRSKEGQGYEYRMKTMSNIDIVPGKTMSNSDISKIDTPSKIDTVLYQELTPPVSNIDIVARGTAYKEKKEKEINPPTPQGVVVLSDGESVGLEDNPFGYKPLKEKSLIESQAEARKKAVLKVCGLNPKIKKHLLKAEDAAVQLKDYTAEYILERYSPGGWWYLHDFRGREGRQPETAWVIDTIAKEMQAPQPRPGPAYQNGRHSTEQPAPSQGLKPIAPGSGRY